MTPIVPLIAACLLVAGGMSAGAQPQVERVETDAQLFAAFDLELPGLVEVKEAVEAGDFTRAKHELATYFRTREGKHWWFDPHQVDRNVAYGAKCLAMAQQIADRTGGFDESRWLPNGELDWLGNASHANWGRMYFWESLGRAYWHSGEEHPAATMWVKLLRSWVKQCPPLSDPGYWATMTVGIHMRTGWPHAFNYFLLSPTFTADDMALFLKSTIEQTRHLRANHSQTSNWLTFEMAGLYASGVLYPELKEAADWRRHAAQIAVSDMDRGYLPDGSSIELCPGYHQFFSNYLRMYDLAKTVGRENEDGIGELLAKCEGPYAYYVKLMAPDRTLPAYNDNAPVDAVKQLQSARDRFPEREDFRWIASDGAEGRAPEYTSCILPHAGAGAMRSGWERDANYLSFDFGPVGYRHAHQDKLNVVVWAYGRQILFDPGRRDYSDTPHGNYCTDTFSHNTVLVDNRPQRRPWYQNPSPTKMPYQPVSDVEWESDASRDFAAGVYEGPYGLPGASDSYPYKKGGNFKQGWGRPATHFRQVLFLKPDLFIVADTLESMDGAAHEYDVRWHLDSTAVRLQDDGRWAVTEDPDVANLQVVPLLSDGLTVRSTSAQTEPELMGWKVLKNPVPATTVQHMKSGAGTVRFVTLLVPLKSGQAPLVSAVESVGDDTVVARLADGRTVTVRPPDGPTSKLSATVSSG